MRVVPLVQARQFSMCDDLLFNRDSYTEHIRVPARIISQSMFKLPDSMSHKTASLMEPFACAVHGIENCPIEPGDFVVINGAGLIGLMFARLAVLKGAQVLVTDISQGRLDVAERMGVWGTLNLQWVGDSVFCSVGRRWEAVSVDATLLHYSQLTVKGVFQTTPLAVKQAFKLLELGVIDERDVIQNEYRLADLEDALLEYASGEVIKNCIVYE